jgi:hypothetical protein
VSEAGVVDAGVAIVGAGWIGFGLRWNGRWRWRMEGSLFGADVA